jgi:type VI secretion system secreted protein Hcp
VIPIDQFSMNFGKIEWEYKPQKPDGSLDSPIKTGWDVMQNTKV